MAFRGEAHFSHGCWGRGGGGGGGGGSMWGDFVGAGGFGTGCVCRRGGGGTASPLGEMWETAARVSDINKLPDTTGWNVSPKSSGSV